ncbi:MAG: type III polyketide synthase [Chitinophagales bacterium]
MKKKGSKGSLLIAIGTAVPENRYHQQAIADFMIRYFGVSDDASRKLSVIYQKSGIDFRHSALPDFFKNGHVPLLFEEPQQNPPLSRRMDIYQAVAIKLAAQAARDCMSELDKLATKKLLPVTHLITVSCTGMSAPGLDLQLMKELELEDHVERTSVNFMGCYAAFHALKMADAICRSNKEATVMIVLVELCSLHFQPEMDNQNMVVNSLFADGAAAMLVTSRQKSKGLNCNALRIDGFYSKVIHKGASMMTWHPSENGFLMGLDALVPQLIEDHAGELITQALDKFECKRAKITHWAIHPGGRKILEAAQKGMLLTDKDLEESYNVLRNFGNMSSPTISFVLKLMMRKILDWKKKERILAAGFGPGITIETAMLQPVIS